MTRMLETSRALLLVGGLVISTCTLLGAQQDPVVQTRVDTVPVISLAISATDVAAQSQIVVTLLRDLRPRVQPVAEIVQIDTALDSLTAELRALRTAPDHFRLDELTPRRLDVLAEQWRSLGRRLAGWDGTVQNRAGDLEDIGGVLDSLLPVWHETRDTAVAQENPEATIERIDVVIALIDSVEMELRDVSAVVLALQSSIAESRITVDDASAAIETAQAGARGRIFQQDSPPIWQSFGQSEEAVQRDSLRGVLTEDVATLRRFAQNNRGGLTAHAAFLAVLIVLMLYLWIRRESWIEGGPPVESAAAVIGHPFAVSVFLAVAASRLFYPDLPAVVGELTSTIIVLSTVTWFPRLLASRAKLPYFALVGLFVFEQITKTIPDGSSGERLSLVLVTVAMVVGLVWLVHSRGGAKIYSSKWWAASQALARFGILVMAAVFVGNMLGYVALTRLVNSATLLLPGKKVSFIWKSGTAGCGLQKCKNSV